MTWGKLPGRVATNARPASARPALAVRVTCARPVDCTLNSAHDLGTACAVCARPGFLVCAQPNFVIVHCLGVTIWILFVDTVHEHYSKGKKKCLVYDLKYEIFILKLL